MSDKYTWDNAGDLKNNCPWTRLPVKIMGAIKRQFFHMVTHVSDNSNLSQEIFAIDTWGAVIKLICFLGHGRKDILTILPTKWRPGFTVKLGELCPCKFKLSIWEIQSDF